MHQELENLREEHKRVGQVLGLIRRLLDDDNDRAFNLIHSAMDYFRDYIDKKHHAQEELLFERVARRDIRGAQAVAGLSEEHDDLAEAVQAIEQLFATQPHPGEGLKPYLRDQLNAYREHLLQHMHAEEGRVFAIADSALEPRDWEVIGEAYRHQRDPLFGPQVEGRFAELKARLDALNST